MQMTLRVSPKGYVLFHIYYGEGYSLDNVVTYSFTSMAHFLGHFGNMLPLTSCEFRIAAEKE